MARVPRRLLCKQTGGKEIYTGKETPETTGKLDYKPEREQRPNFRIIGVQSSKTLQGKKTRTRRASLRKTRKRRAHERSEELVLEQRREEKPACRVSCGRLADNLDSLKYSPKTSAAQHFHCSKYQ